MKTFVAVALVLAAARAPAAPCPALLDHQIRKLHLPERADLCEMTAGRPVLIVNTASHCGFTPQLAGLEELHLRYRGQGLVVIGVPSDDFHQAAADESTAARVCFVNFGVTFTMLSPQRVRGSDAHPLFRELAERAGAPDWNFNKYLISPDGLEIYRFASAVTPLSDDLRTALERLLPPG